MHPYMNIYYVNGCKSVCVWVCGCLGIHLQLCLRAYVYVCLCVCVCEGESRRERERCVSARRTHASQSSFMCLHSPAAPPVFVRETLFFSLIPPPAPPASLLHQTNIAPEIAGISGMSVGSQWTEGGSGGNKRRFSVTPGP